ncbi:MAG: hypothetical protein AB7S99_13195 [Pseudodonghicola sp.]
MRYLVLALAAAGALAGGQVSAGNSGPALTRPETGIVEHGGGCRKSSPPGKCCHMQKSTGKVHCH